MATHGPHPASHPSRPAEYSWIQKMCASNFICQWKRAQSVCWLASQPLATSPKVWLFSNLILSAPRAHHQAARLPHSAVPLSRQQHTGPTAGGNCVLLTKSLSLSVRRKRHHLGFFLLANCCNESETEYFVFFLGSKRGVLVVFFFGFFFVGYDNNLSIVQLWALYWTMAASMVLIIL